MKKILWSVVFTLLVLISASGQEKRNLPVLISVSNNATQFPGSGYLGIFTVPVHPGISAGTWISLKDWEKSSMYESFRLGGFYHKYSQLAIQLYSELIYQYRFGAFSIEPQFQAGYMMAFTDMQMFELNGSTYEEKTFKGRSQFMTGAGLGIAYTFGAESGKPVKLNLGYLVNLQMPFIKNYTPVLIISSLQAGVMFYIPCKSKTTSR
jgi:hypothetical protein